MCLTKMNEKLRVEQHVYSLSLLLLTIQVCDHTNTDIWLGGDELIEDTLSGDRALCHSLVTTVFRTSAGKKHLKIIFLRL